MPERPNDGRTPEPTLEDRVRYKIQREPERRAAAQRAMDQAGAAADSLSSRIAENIAEIDKRHAKAYVDEFERREANKQQQPAPSAPQLATIWFHGEGQYSIDRLTPFQVSEQFDNILQAFLASQASMQTRELEDKSGVTNASRAMKDLAAWNGGVFKDAMRRPSGKSKGGYFVRVQRL